MVEQKIAIDLPSEFALFIDGWNAGSDHFLGIFACYQSAKGGRKTPVPAYSPLLDESDLSARSQKEFIEYCLQVFNKSTDNKMFIIADNAKTSMALSDLLQMPMTSFVSHRLNLAVKTYCWKFEEHLSEVNDLMRKLSSIERSAKLRRCTNLCPVMRNATRCSFTYNMLDRFFGSSKSENLLTLQTKNSSNAFRQ